MNRDECAHVFTAWPEWGPDQLMVCDNDCGARATMRDPALIEAALRERIATEIEAVNPSDFNTSRGNGVLGAFYLAARIARRSE